MSEDLRTCKFYKNFTIVIIPECITTFFSEVTKLGLNISRIVSKLGGKNSSLSSPEPSIRYFCSKLLKYERSCKHKSNSRISEFESTGNLFLMRRASKAFFFQSCKYIRFLFLGDQISAWSILLLWIEKETVQFRNRNKKFSRVRTLILLPVHGSLINDECLSYPKGFLSNKTLAVQLRYSIEISFLKVSRRLSGSVSTKCCMYALDDLTTSVGDPDIQLLRFKNSSLYTRLKAKPPALSTHPPPLSSLRGPSRDRPTRRGTWGLGSNF